MKDNRGRILTFRLGGSARLPVQEAAERVIAAIPAELDPALVKQGMASFTRWCSVCHGAGAESGGVLPDLRKAVPEVLRPENFASIVLEGAFQARGMPSFAKFLTAADVAAIRQYVLSRRAALLAETASGSR